MQSPIRVADETFVIPMPFEIPGFGILYINSMVIRGQEPILVETSAPHCTRRLSPSGLLVGGSQGRTVDLFEP
jgi:hypothetical protein